MAGKLSKAQIKEYREGFASFDKDGNGKITAEELGDVMKKMGQTPSEDELKMMIAEVDVDNNGTISFDEFLIMMKSSAKEFEEVFKVFDKDGNGFISRSELKEAMKLCGDDISDQEIDEMIKNADSDGDGRVNYEEFAKMMTNPK